MQVHSKRDLKTVTYFAFLIYQGNAFQSLGACTGPITINV